MPKRMTVEEADNGYVVSMSDGKGNEKRLVCKTMKEAHVAMEEMMGKGKGGEHERLKKKFS